MIGNLLHRLKARAERRLDMSKPSLPPGMTASAGMAEKFAALEQPARRRTLSDFGL
jgi:hypothetical protein